MSSNAQQIIISGGMGPPLWFIRIKIPSGKLSKKARRCARSYFEKRGKLPRALWSHGQSTVDLDRSTDRNERMMSINVYGSFFVHVCFHLGMLVLLPCAPRSLSSFSSSSSQSSKSAGGISSIHLHTSCFTLS